MDEVIATPDQVKVKLGLAVDDDSRDDEIVDALAGAQATVLRITRYVLADADLVDEFADVRVGDEVRLLHRPIDPEAILSVEVRAAGSSSWSAIDADVTDYARGRVRVAPASRGLPRRLRPTQAHVRVSYSALALEPVPGDLSNATADLAAAGIQTAATAGILSVRAGDVAETYGDAGGAAPIPLGVAGVLAAHDPSLAGSA